MPADSFRRSRRALAVARERRPSPPATVFRGVASLGRPGRHHAGGREGAREGALEARGAHRSTDERAVRLGRGGAPPSQLRGRVQRVHAVRHAREQAREAGRRAGRGARLRRVRSRAPRRPLGGRRVGLPPVPGERGPDDDGDAPPDRTAPLGRQPPPREPAHHHPVQPGDARGVRTPTATPFATAIHPRPGPGPRPPRASALSSRARRSSFPTRVSRNNNNRRARRLSVRARPPIPDLTSPTSPRRVRSQGPAR